MMLDLELNLGGHYVGVLVDGYLIHRGIVLFLLLLLRFLLLLRHAEAL